MIAIDIPGRAPLRLDHLVMDVNGTLAYDGILITGVAERIAALRDRVKVHLLTADTHGQQSKIDSQLGMVANRLSAGNEQKQKAAFVNNLGASSVVTIGQGTNDAGMLRAAALGICVMSVEGAAGEAVAACDILIPTIFLAFDLLDKPARLIASLRR